MRVSHAVGSWSNASASFPHATPSRRLLDKYPTPSLSSSSILGFSRISVQIDLWWPPPSSLVSRSCPPTLAAASGLLFVASPWPLTRRRFDRGGGGPRARDALWRRAIGVWRRNWGRSLSSRCRISRSATTSASGFRGEWVFLDFGGGFVVIWYHFWSVLSLFCRRMRWFLRRRLWIRKGDCNLLIWTFRAWEFLMNWDNRFCSPLYNSRVVLRKLTSVQAQRRGRRALEVRLKKATAFMPLWPAFSCC